MTDHRLLDGDEGVLRAVEARNADTARTAAAVRPGQNHPVHFPKLRGPLEFVFYDGGTVCARFRVECDTSSNPNGEMVWSADEGGTWVERLRI